ncbi:hypothetical protein NBRC10512_004315 [Rhodotorula toruloides]|uniref:RHTO0S12e01574g1_1 n=2 Tax=Rhodotorula toruloides TaxID=5286 RepID=A0A061BGS4_RHOTO|nr:capsular associated protein [Rhodotorula toruloides NP11]EMS23270.1 capsular associated protein [Rhodotorula toruloides NP11]CDR46206.1 RHTO0S12e01574g1_1 [Rhodotorula toruloides]
MTRTSSPPSYTSLPSSPTEEEFPKRWLSRLSLRKGSLPAYFAEIGRGVPGRSTSRRSGLVLLLAALLLVSLTTLSPSTQTHLVSQFRRSHPDNAPRNLQLIQRRVVRKLQVREEPLVIGVAGGSISKMPSAYGEHLVAWLNRNYAARRGPHKLVNAAIPASESGVSSICLNTLFGFRPTAHDSTEPPIDLLLVEFAYNDNALPVGREGNPEFEISRTANFERIFRTALSWPVPVIVVEVAGFAGDIRVATPNNWFFRSSGLDHALVAQHYSVPIVDFALQLYTYPDASDLPKFFVDSGIHPSPAGHNLIASLIAQELVFHLSLGSSDTPLVNLQLPNISGVSWSRLASSSVHGLPSPTPSLEIASPLRPLPAPRWQLGSSPSWDCVSSQIGPTVALLKKSVVASDGWEYGVDLSDGGQTRSGSRPGLTANSTGAHLVLRLTGDGDGRTALLYRRSWQESADALVWVDQNPDDVAGWEEREGPRCPPEPKLLQGSWDTPSTQMVIDEICASRRSWSGRIEAEKESFLHLLTVPARTGKAGTYFKSYGFATAE